MSRHRQSIDLLVYGQGSINDLLPTWRDAISATGVRVDWPETFAPQWHAGPLPLMVEVTEKAPSFLTASQQLRATVDLFVEQFEHRLSPHGGLEDVPRPLADRMARADFCLILTLSPTCPAVCCIGAFYLAAGLIRVADGVMVDLEEEIYWDAEQAFQNAERYLLQVMKINDRET